MKQHSPKFLNDLKNSQAKETAFVEALLRKQLTGETTQHLEDFPDYDISATGSTGRISYYEVKCNTSGFTEKTFVEIAKVKGGYLVPCGLKTTKADYYVFTFKDNPKFYIIRTSKLRQMPFEHIYIDKYGYQLGILSTDTLLSSCNAVL